MYMRYMRAGSFVEDFSDGIYLFLAFALMINRKECSLCASNHNCSHFEFIPFLVNLKQLEKIIIRRLEVVQ